MGYYLFHLHSGPIDLESLTQHPELKMLLTKRPVAFTWEFDAELPGIGVIVSWILLSFAFELVVPVCYMHSSQKAFFHPKHGDEERLPSQKR